MPAGTEPSSTPQSVTFNARVLKVPYLLLVAIVLASVSHESWWLLLGLGSVFLGWACAAPNLNLADGFLPQLSLVVAVVLVVLGWSVAAAVLSACWAAWLLCSLELAWRCATGRTGVRAADREEAA